MRLRYYLIENMQPALNPNSSFEMWESNEEAPIILYLYLVCVAFNHLLCKNWNKKNIAPTNSRFLNQLVWFVANKNLFFFINNLGNGVWELQLLKENIFIILKKRSAFQIIKSRFQVVQNVIRKFFIPFSEYIYIFILKIYRKQNYF